MRKFEALGSVRGHEMNGVFIGIRSDGDHSTGLAEISEVLDPFSEFRGFGGGLVLPVVGKRQRCLQGGGIEVEAKLFSDELQARSCFGLLAGDFGAGTEHGLDYGIAAGNCVEYGCERNGYSLL